MVSNPVGQKCDLLLANKKRNAILLVNIKSRFSILLGNSRMPTKKKNLLRLQEYNNKRRRLAKERWKKVESDENEESETDEKNAEAYERAETYEEEEEEENEEEETIQTRLLTTALIWNKPEKNNARTVKGIPKTTYYCKFGTSGTLSNAAKGTSKIINFWGNKKSLSGFGSRSLASNSCISEPFAPSSSLISPTLSKSLAETDDNSILCERILQLWDDLLKNGKILTASEYNRQCAVYEYLI
ncbi:hypothetical protein Glove_232g30 [Diversispora epigaea]|uniref:Uncharacterized protein n=1 Tax=Diversispora epigaea TaxID=1348612 RepID=A0A397IKG0_9GLOM|nr:hypothetical protein Glove_232g30 [Diversispora epigaea]